MKRPLIVLKIGGSLLRHWDNNECFFAKASTGLKSKFSFSDRENNELTPYFYKLTRLLKGFDILIVPCGYKNVDKIRDEYKRKTNQKVPNISSEYEIPLSINSYYHWKAIEGMDNTAEYLLNKLNLLIDHYKRYVLTFLKDFNPSINFNLNINIKIIEDFNAINMLYNNISQTPDIPSNLSFSYDNIQNSNTPNNNNPKSSQDCTIYILKPFRFLKYKDPDLLPHSWAVTSDSITIYFGHLLKQGHVFLIKDVDFIEINNKKYHRISVRKIIKYMSRVNYQKLVDEYLGKGILLPIDPWAPFLLRKLKMRAYIFNGCRPLELINLFYAVLIDMKKLKYLGKIKNKMVLIK